MPASKVILELTPEDLRRLRGQGDEVLAAAARKAPVVRDAQKF